MASWCFSSSDISNESTAEQILIRFLVTETVLLTLCVLLEETRVILEWK